ncbi:MAG: ATPase domain-containing protein [Candidatus Bilamarchaeaceae archaeon]
MRERKFIKSGIPGLDKVLNGGFLENSIITIGGPTGVGKSTFGMQFLYIGAYQFDEPGMYISIEESRDSMLFNMSGYAWDIEGIEKKQKLIFLDYPVYEVDQFIQQSGGIKEIINKSGVKRVVIDSIMPIALYFKGEEERKNGFLKFIDNIRKWETTTLIISEDTTVSSLDALPNTTYGIESFTDGWINLSYYFDQKKNERLRFIEVIKMKGAPHSMKRYYFEIGKEGVKVLTK